MCEKAENGVPNTNLRYLQSRKNSDEEPSILKNKNGHVIRAAV